MVATTAKKIAKPANKSNVKKDIKKEKKTFKGVSKDFEIDEDERHQGKVTFYDLKRGFGFIELSQKDLVPDNKIMVHWREIQSSDRWPFLQKEHEVEFSLAKKREGKDQYTIKAKAVSQPGGDDINLQDERDSKRDFVGHQNMRYLGNVKFFDFQKGFGYVKLQDGYDIPEDVTNELKVSRDEISAGSDAPRLNNDMEVEFGIVKSNKGHYQCYNVTLPGGETISREIVENRDNVSDSFYEGTVQFWNWKSSYGMISPNNVDALPVEFVESMKADHEKRKKKSTKENFEMAIYFRRTDYKDPSAQMKHGSKVSFKVYTDNQGVGACDVELLEE